MSFQESQQTEPCSNRSSSIPPNVMDSCEICGQPRLSPAARSDVTCSGPCAGTVHASCAAIAGVRLANIDSGIFWFCDRCRRGLHSLTKDKTEVNTAADPVQLPELPTEVWIEVFRNLSDRVLLKMRLVCRRWRDIVTGCKELTAKLTVTFGEREVDPDYLLPVQNVLFNDIKQIKPWWPPFGQGLIDIKIQEGGVTISDVLEMLKHTPNLKRFELADCTLIDKHPVSADFHLEKLEKLVLYNIYKLKGSLKIFRKLCPNVKLLKFMWNDEDALMDMLDVAKLVKRYQHSLEELEVYCSNEFLDEIIKFNGLKLKKLTAHYPFEDDALVDYSKLVALLRMHPTMEYLDIQSMLTFDDSNQMMLNEICQLLPKLKSLSICANHMDIAFLFQTVKLQTFNLSGDQQSFTSIQSSLTDARHSNMTNLHMERVHLPDNFLRQFPTALPNVRILTLKKCKIGAWSTFLTAMSQLALLQDLTLSISDVTATVRPSSRHTILTNLKYLTYSKTDTISETSSKDMLIALLTMCPGLRELSLKNVALGDQVLAAIFLNLTQMKKLTTSNCEKKSLLESYIWQNCCALEELRGLES